MAISDLAVLRDQPELLGTVASTATAWRVLDRVDEAVLGRLRQARAVARGRAWLARAELGRVLPAVRAAGRVLPGAEANAGYMSACPSTGPGLAISLPRSPVSD